VLFLLSSFSSFLIDHVFLSPSFLKRSKYELVSRNVQIDNQLRDAVFPVVLTRRFNPAPKDAPPFVHVSVVAHRQGANMDSIQHFKYIGLSLQEFNLSIDEVFAKHASVFFSLDKRKDFNSQVIGDVVSFLYLPEERNKRIEPFLYDHANTHDLSILRGSDEEKTATDDSLRSGDPRHERSSLSGTHSSEPIIHFDLIELNTIKAHLTFRTVPNESDSYSLVEDPFPLFSRSVGLVWVNLDAAPLTLNGKLLKHVTCSVSALGDSLGSRYKSDLLMQLHLLVGSSKILGNPVGLISHLGTGVYDLFHEPAVGLAKVCVDSWPFLFPVFSHWFYL